MQGNKLRLLKVFLLHKDCLLISFRLAMREKKQKKAGDETSFEETSRSKNRQETGRIHNVRFFLPTVPGTLAMEPDFFLPPSLVGKERGKWEIFGLDRKTAQ